MRFWSFARLSGRLPPDHPAVVVVSGRNRGITEEGVPDRGGFPVYLILRVFLTARDPPGRDFDTTCEQIDEVRDFLRTLGCGVLTSEYQPLERLAGVCLAIARRGGDWQVALSDALESLRPPPAAVQSAGDS
jgi:hypothetical protein